MIALLEAYRAGVLKPKYWLPNSIAGLVVGAVAFPLAMAFSIASGLKPEQGLYTAIFAGLIVSVFGGSRVQIAGPTGAFIVILVNIIQQYGIEGLQLATLLAGLILIFLGMSKLGSVIKFIPEPVILGFTTGIAVVIFLGAWKDFFGLNLNMSTSNHFHEKLILLLKSLPKFHGPTLALSCISLSIILLMSKFFKKIPGILITILIGIAIQAIFQFEGLATIGSTFGGIPNQLPRFQPPTITIDRVLELIGPSFTIAMLGAIESLLSAVIADEMANTKHNANQELIGQGLANVITPLFGGFAATGAIARTATNIRTGANSPLAGIFHSITLIGIILLFAPFVAQLPLCILSAILFVVAYNMSEVSRFVFMFKHAHFYDKLILIITFLLTVLTDLIVAINIGVILSLLLFTQRMSQSISIEQDNDESLKTELESCGFPNLPEGLTVYKIRGPFFFGASHALEKQLAPQHSQAKVVVFRLKYVPFMDATGLKSFSGLLEAYRKLNITIYLCEANPRIIRKLTKTNILYLVQGHQVYSSIAEVLRCCTLVQHCSESSTLLALET